MPGLNLDAKELRERVRRWVMAYVRARGIKNASHFVRLVDGMIKNNSITAYQTEGAAIGLDAVYCLRKIFGANANKIFDREYGSSDDDDEVIGDEVSAAIARARTARGPAHGRERQKARQG
jgi:hypothetical protein